MLPGDLGISARPDLEIAAYVSAGHLRIVPAAHWCDVVDLDFACVDQGEVGCRRCGREWRRWWSKRAGGWRWRVSVSEWGPWMSHGNGFVNRETGELATIHHLADARDNDVLRSALDGREAPGSNPRPLSEARRDQVGAKPK